VFWGNPESLAEESHNEEGYLEYPNFTKPSVWRELEVPAILLSGNHGEIASGVPPKPQSVQRRISRHQVELHHVQIARLYIP
jgi:tRNA (guanine-N1)-methyltransferase